MICECILQKTTFVDDCNKSVIGFSCCHKDVVIWLVVIVRQRIEIMNLTYKFVTICNHSECVFTLITRRSTLANQHHTEQTCVSITSVAISIAMKVYKCAFMHFSFLWFITHMNMQCRIKTNRFDEHFNITRAVPVIGKHSQRQKEKQQSHGNCRIFLCPLFHTRCHTQKRYASV